MKNPDVVERPGRPGQQPSVEEPRTGSLAADAWRQFCRHPGAVGGSLVLTLVVLAAIFAVLSPFDPEASDVLNRLQPPSWQHVMGTDPLGRDVLTRVLYGGRISLFVGVMVVVIALIIGVPVGAAAGYFGGWVDNLLMRITDAALTLPSLLVLILLSAMLHEIDLPLLERNSPMTIALVIGLLSWMTVARLVRASFLAIREKEFIVAANSLGASDLRIIVRHILPNALGPVIVEATLEMGYAIMQESGLSFLGLGIQPPTPSWGNLLSNAQAHLSKHPWLAIFPGLMIFLTIISVNYIGDGLRDALDPYKVLTKVGEV
ncbi:MAG: ABC transporter permease [Anaerolineae bacterium]|jgi:peptide/nickel transport system permease protein